MYKSTLRKISLVVFILAFLTSVGGGPTATAGVGFKPGKVKGQGPVASGSPSQADNLAVGLSAEGYSPGQQDYYLVQFHGPVQAKDKKKLEQLGARIFNYLPDFAFIVKMDGAAARAVESLKRVRWVRIYQPSQKIDPALAKKLAAQNVSFFSTAGEFVVTIFKGEDPQAIALEIEQQGGEVLKVAQNDFSTKLRVRFDPNKLEAVAEIAGVKWIEKAPVWKPQNDVAAGIINVTDAWRAAVPNLFGAGQVVGIADTGLDQGSPDPALLHDDFEDGSGNSRVTIIDRSGDGAEDVLSGHGTHVAGSVLGNGALSGSNPAAHSYEGSFAGIAPEAELVFQAIEDDSGDLVGIPDPLDELFSQVYSAPYDVRIHLDSWGSPEAGSYTSNSEELDQFVWNNKDFLIVYAAGNQGTDVDGDGVVDPTSIISPATAKNCLTVGASESDRPAGSSPIGFGSTWGLGWPGFSLDPINSDHVSDNTAGIAAISSRGPVLDGRFKPDLVAPGTNIASTKSSVAGGTISPWGDGGLAPDYTFNGGTSSAAALAAGAAALVRQFYTDVKGIVPDGNTPSAALIKATLLNGATDISPGQYGTGTAQEIPDSPRPNNVEGWGRLDLEESIPLLNGRTLRYQDQTTGLDTGDTDIYNFTVVDGTIPLKATLVWSDYPGSTVAGGGLVNDLDLILIDPSSNKHYPNNANQSGASTVISYNDDNYESLWRAEVDNRGLAVRFTPVSYPATLQTARFALNTTATSVFRCNVWDDDGAGGLPGTLLFQQDISNITIPAGGNYFDVDISGVTITSGSFYIELHYTTNDANSNPQLYMDETTPSNRSYIYVGDDAPGAPFWSLVPFDIFPDGSFAIQAVVKAEDASTKSDRVNNAVGIDLANPAAGSYTIRVEGYNVPQGSQPYALVVTGGSLTALTEVVAPAAPSDLGVTSATVSSIAISWSDNSDNEDNFSIERKTGATGTFSEIQKVNPDVTTYTDNFLSEGTSYFYRVRALRSAGDSAYSNEVNGTTLPAAPSNLTASSSSSSSVNLSWTDNSAGEVGFKILRRTTLGGTYTQVNTTGADITSITDAGLSESTTYYYRVEAFNDGGDSITSNEASATTAASSGDDSSGGGGGGGWSCFINTAAGFAHMGLHTSVARKIAIGLGFVAVVGVLGLGLRRRLLRQK